jgi:outer membrane protein assembly factor BamB
MLRTRAVLLLCAALSLPAAARAQLDAGPGDWPGWRGPNRTGVSTETGLLKEWPKGGPPLVWKATGLGNGYSTPAIYKGRIYLLGGKSGGESVICLDARDGKEIWSTKIGPVAKAGYAGPRSTPTVDGDRLYALGSDGDLACLETESGKVQWAKNFAKDFDGARGNWAYAESPLIDGDLLICTPGGKKATIVALNKKGGDEVWRTVASDKAGYASPIVAEAGGVKQYVTFLSGGVVGVSAKDGKELWRYRGTANGTANIPTPIFHDGQVFSASGYNAGGGLVQLTADGDKVSAKEVYFSKDLRNHHGGFVRVGDYVYGTNYDVLLCVNFKTGEKKWSERCVGKGSTAAADGMLFVRGEKGPVALVEATPDGYKEKGRFDQPDRSSASAWAHPVVAGGRLYLRDQDVLLCYDVKAK